jgi:alpha/beta superfamily hydrolase
MNSNTQNFFITGAAGALECALDLPDIDHIASPRGVALIAHPHPLYGGTMDNKVAQTLARAFVAVGYAAVRMNFRGVGKSDGTHDEGRGETDDMALLLTHMQTQMPGLPTALAGFSFGTFVQAQLQQRLIAQEAGAERLVLIAAAAGKWAMPPVPANTILLHGDLDDTIPLSVVLEWLRPQDIPVIVVPGADHFFHRKLQHVKAAVVDAWQR